MTTRHSSTVVLVRAGVHPVEVFMVKRHAKSGFMANAHVFPGGQLDVADTEASARRFVTGHTDTSMARILAPMGARLPDDSPLTAGQPLGLVLAAIRELFEEAGILLAHTDAGLVRLDDARAPIFAEHRAALQQGRDTLAGVAEKRALTFPANDLAYFAHWITPGFHKRRFNTRFFLAHAPPDQEARHDNTETVDSAWFAPVVALEAHCAGELELPPPMLAILTQLLAFDTPEAAFSWALARQVDTVMTRLEVIDNRRTLLMPTDPVRSGIHSGEPTRFVLRDHRWHFEVGPADANQTLSR